MKIVTYNINGLRPRVAQFGSLSNLLASLDADIICFQETKLAKQDLREDLVRAQGYEAFFSSTRATQRSRSAGYSGVATFCRVKSAYQTNELALPVSAQEGLTGLLCDSVSIEEDFEGFSREELLEVDSEGRCIITDHEHFVLFNVYGPRADSDDAERVQFKRTFYNILQRRWECFLHKGRKILVVGDLNIAPAAIDRCDAGPDFDNNEFRKWFRSLLRENGGKFIDVFRGKHPERKDAYTCWSTSSGAEVFNYGSRIDHILCSESCLHEEQSQACHNFLTCHVVDCDILMQFKRWKQENGTSRWKDGRSVKLEGSDHAPVFVDLVEMPSISEHNTPSLSSRFYSHIHGNQQTLVSMLMKRKLTAPAQEGRDSVSDGNMSIQMCSQPRERGMSSPNKKSEDFVSDVDGFSQSTKNVAPYSVISSSANNRTKTVSSVHPKKKSKHSQGSQLSLKMFFQSNLTSTSTRGSIPVDIRATQSDECTSYSETVATSSHYGNFDVEGLVEKCSSSQTDDDHDSQKSPLIDEKANSAVTEWRRIHQLMQSTIPLCKGHKEPCVVRVVKKAGPSFGKRFYVCNRAEGPASNPEANCGYFKWATSSKTK